MLCSPLQRSLDKRLVFALGSSLLCGFACFRACHTRSIFGAAMFGCAVDISRDSHKHQLFALGSCDVTVRRGTGTSTHGELVQPDTPREVTAQRYHCRYFWSVR